MEVGPLLGAADEQKVIRLQGLCSQERSKSRLGLIGVNWKEKKMSYQYGVVTDQVHLLCLVFSACDHFFLCFSTVL